jgi:hypothetical protein
MQCKIIFEGCNSANARVIRANIANGLRPRISLSPFAMFARMTRAFAELQPSKIILHCMLPHLVPHICFFNFVKRISFVDLQWSLNCLVSPQGCLR